MRSPAWLLRILAAALVSGAVAVHADDLPKRVKYVPPDGFAEYKWGDPRSRFTRLPAQPIGVGAAWMERKAKEKEFFCITSLNMPISGGTGAADGCDIVSMLQQARGQFEAGGTYVLSEYSLEGQGFRFGDADPVTLYPVVFQFCANWSGGKGKRTDMPQNFDEMNKFCGVRLLFETETLEQLKSLPRDHVTTYDRMLKKLMAKFGKPNGWMTHGRVVIETFDGNDPDDLADQKFTVWRWCPARDRGLKTECTASVTLTLNPATGKGTVLYSTPLLWEYAYARENFGFKGDRLFKMLHARK
jgi:hypothetical protein